jgi:signal transduction histidine kinase
LARELHDIVSHNLSVVVVQAAGARAQGSSDSATLEKIERSGRESLVEMRRLLGVLRRDGDDASLMPQPGIAQLDSLADHVRAAGLAVTLAVDGDYRDIPAPIDHTAYRIVQEALTNTLKHAGPAHATVTVRRAVAAVSIEVADDGTGPAVNTSGSGHGLLGMRERAGLLGGELCAERGAAGGFVVSARLPLDGAAH